MDVIIRPELAEDWNAIDTVVAAAFASPVEARLVRDLRASDGYRPDTALVAVAGSDVVGHVMVSRTELRDGAESHDVAMLAPLAVAPDRQRQGIGAALVRGVCAIADLGREEMVLLQGDPAYYGRFGFVPSTEHGVTMDLPDWAPAEAAQVLRLSAWTGTLRGHLVLPPAFDGLD